MKGYLNFNGIDVYTSFGAIVLKGSMASFIGFPSAKAVEANDWYEEDGIEPDLSSLKLDKREFTMNFAFTGGVDKMNEFIDELRSNTYFMLEFVKYRLSKRLRYIGMSGLNVANGMTVCTLKFSEDFSPLLGRDFDDFSSSVVSSDDRYRIDGINLSNFGVSILKGTFSSLMTKGDTKKALERNIGAIDGVIYDENALDSVSSRTMTLNCLLRAGSYEEAWNNWYGLLKTLVYEDKTKRPTEECLRALYVEGVAENVKCYYKSASVNDFFTNGVSVWIRFALNLEEISREKYILPLEYKKVAYIEGTGSQYIDTEIYLDTTHRYEMQFQLTGNALNSPIFGMRNVSAYNGGAIFCITYANNGNVGSGKFMLYLKDKSGVVPSGGWTLSKDVQNIVIDASKGIIKHGNIVDSITNFNHFVTEYSAFLFSNNVAGTKSTPQKARFYAFAEYDQDGDVLHDFVPCYRKSDGKPGMYDIISREFFVNKGTGEFVLGPKV